MRYSRMHLLSSAAAIPFAIGAIAAIGVAAVVTTDAPVAMAQSNPCAAKKPACNPCAAQKPAANPCNPCAAKASACNPCNPCGAQAAMAVSEKCFVPRLRQASACNPCAAQKPAANPCNPCAAKAPGCNPCAAQKSTANPCNPCAAQKSAANPCGAAANPCNPCNPCAAGAAVELTDAEAASAYDCLYPEIRAAYANTGVASTNDWKSWGTRFSKNAYPSATHGGRLVNNYANSVAKAEYGKFEKLKSAPRGSVLVKDSFSATPAGGLSVGPLFLMEKMAPGFNADTADWRYIMYTPDGKLFGITKGENAAGMGFCHECHSASSDTDYLMFLPDEYRS